MGILNINGYFDELIRFLDTMVQKGLLKQMNRNMILISDDIDDLLSKMKAYKAPVGGKWIRKENL